jgi:hypothetical protein
MLALKFVDQWQSLSRHRSLAATEFVCLGLFVFVVFEKIKMFLHEEFSSFPALIPPLHLDWLSGHSKFMALYVSAFHHCSTMHM